MSTPQPDGLAAVPPSPYAPLGPRSLSTSWLVDMGTTKPGAQLQPGDLYKPDLIPAQSYLFYPSK